MSHHILVIEYEPRYIQRIEEASAANGIATSVARTGDEAIRSLSGRKFDLITLSTIIPRYSTAQLIKAIRSDPVNAATPILLTTSGYSGSDPRSDARRLGASEMIVKPYSSTDFVQKVQQVLNIPESAAATGPGEAEPTVRMSAEELFGDPSHRGEAGRTLEQRVPTPPEGDGEPEAAPTARHRKSGSTDVDKMLADTLAGMRIPKTKRPASTVAPDLDKLLEDTLSGLEPRRSREAALATPQKPAESDPLTGSPESGPPETVELPEQSSLPAEEGVRSSAFEEAPEASPELDPFPEAAQGPAPPSLPLSEEESAEAGADAETTVPQQPEEVEEEEEGRFGQYILLEKIATGGMAEVWKARMRGLEGFEKIVAIKKILPHLSDNDEFIEMFVDEAKLAAQLNHNNIIHIYDLGKIDQSWFIAMEYIDGHDIKSLLARGREAGRPLPAPLALFIASRVASALDYAHRKKGFDDQQLGLVHRDVSPQNILISRDGDIKLCDFGIAKAATKASHTQAGALKGKLQYMSPEQAWGREIDHRSDIFATSAVLFEMLAGRKLFSGESELSVLDQVREAYVPVPSTYARVPRSVDALVMRGLEKDPAARFQTAGEMARAIDEILYAYKPAPTSSDLAQYVAAIEAPDRVEMPSVAAMAADTVAAPQQPPREEQPPEVPVSDTVPASVPEPAVASAKPKGAVRERSAEETIPAGVSPLSSREGRAIEGEPPAVLSASEPRRRKRSAAPMAIAAVLVLLTIGAGAYVIMGGREPAGAVTDVAAPLGVPAPQQALFPEPVEEGITPESLEAEQLAIGTFTALGDEDLQMINEAVQRRIQAERERLDRERPGDAGRPAQETPRQQQATEQPPPAAPARQTPAAPPEAPTATQQPTATQPPTPQPSEATPSGETQPSSPAPAEVRQDPPPAPPPAAQPAPARVREGDFVPPGTPGLTDPEIISLKRIMYPPLAKRNRVEGLVIVRALISETGAVLDVEVLRGVSQNVGINEAAVEMVRGGRFQPAVKDGVKVQAWKTVPIPFKME
jgi:TonB family protein